MNGAVVGCGIVSGTLAPVIYNNHNLMAYTQTCQDTVEAIQARALSHGRPDIIVWGSTDEQASIVDPPSGGHVLASGTPLWTSVMLHRMDSRVREFIATGSKVVLLLQPAKALESDSNRSEKVDQGYERLNNLLRTVASQFPRDVALVDLAERVCPSGPPCPYTVHGLALRPDNLHYSVSGSLWVARWLVPRVVAAAESVH